MAHDSRESYDISKEHANFEFPQDPHELLGVAKNAKPEEIESAYRARQAELARKKSGGQVGLSPLLDEAEYEAKLAQLKQAHDSMLENPTDSSERIDDRDYEAIWDSIRGNMQLRGILAELVRGDFNQRGKLNLDDVEEFYKIYPNEDEYHSKAEGVMAHFLSEIARLNSPSKLAEYKQSAIDFTDAMFAKK